jgi:FtsZ-interacting cell division protein ZipA
MPQLRLTLLVLGLIFLAALAWWELRRPHQARGSTLPRPAPEPEWDSPPLELPRMSARDPEPELPIVEVDPTEFAALAAQAEAPEPEPEPEHEPQAQELAPSEGGVEGLLDELAAEQTPDPPISEFTESFEEESVTVLPVAEVAPAPDVPAPSSVVVDWPAPEVSKVLAVRLMSAGEKFSGRAVRMALSSEGFILGKFAIYHKPAADGRALLSIASLTKPGTFESHSIDMQRYSGLNLFTVLPGPLPGPEAVDELLVCAQVLSQRLRGTLQDDQGQPLSPARTALMRNAAAAASP